MRKVKELRYDYPERSNVKVDAISCMTYDLRQKWRFNQRALFDAQLASIAWNHVQVRPGNIQVKPERYDWANRSTAVFKKNDWYQTYELKMRWLSRSVARGEFIPLCRAEDEYVKNPV